LGAIHSGKEKELKPNFLIKYPTKFQVLTEEAGEQGAGGRGKDSGIALPRGFRATKFI